MDKTEERLRLTHLHERSSVGKRERLENEVGWSGLEEKAFVASLNGGLDAKTALFLPAPLELQYIIYRIVVTPHFANNLQLSNNPYLLPLTKQYNLAALVIAKATPP